MAKIVSRKTAALAVAVIAVSAGILAAVALGNSNRQAYKYGPSPSEPFPALWQMNTSGAPYLQSLLSDNTLFTIIYESNSTQSLSSGADTVHWNVVALSEYGGAARWNRSVVVSEEGNINPQLSWIPGNLVLSGYGSSVTVNGIQEVNGSSIFVIEFNASAGSIDGIAVRHMPPEFGITGYLMFAGNALIYSFTGYGSDYLAAGSIPFSSGAVAGWYRNLTVTPSSYSDGSLAFADSKFTVLAAWNVIALNTDTGATVSSVPYSAVGADQINIVNGKLIGGTLYFISEFSSSAGRTDLNLKGLNLATASIDLNVTVGHIAVPSFPVSVRAIGNMLIAPVFPGLTYYVLSLTGSLLWSSMQVSQRFNGVNVNLGIPQLALASGEWLLEQSVRTNSGNRSVTGTMVVFQAVNASDGQLEWSSSFTYYYPVTSLQFYPPDGFGPPEVLPTASDGAYFAYDWGNNIGVAAG